MPLSTRWVTVFAAATVLGLAAVGLARLPTATPACRSGAEPLRRLELVFGLSRKAAPDITESDWRQFLAREITPRFPDGLTVLEGQGQWRGVTGEPVREASRLVLIWVRPRPETDAAIEAIRTAWKTAYAQESVIRAESWDCVSF